MPMTSLPVTMTATRRAHPGRGEELHRWALDLCATAAASPGHVRCDVRRHPVRDSVELTVAVTFDSAAAASAWESSATRAALVARGDALTRGEATTAALLPAGPGQPRWRTALIVWAGLFPFALGLNVVAAPLEALPVLLRTLLTTAVLVPLAVYVGIPAVHRALGFVARRRR